MVDQNIQVQISVLMKGVQNVQRQMTGVGKATATTAKNTERLNSIDLSVLGTNLFILSSQMASLGRRVTDVTDNMIDSFKEFNLKMREAQTIIGQFNIQGLKGEAAFGAMSASVRDLAATVPQSPSELGAGLYDILSAGVTNSEDAYMALQASAQASVAGLTQVNKAAQSGIAVMNAYGMTAEDLQHIFDVQFQTIKVGILRYEQLAAEQGRLAAAGRFAGQDLETVNAALATMTTRGFNTAESATRVVRLLQALPRLSEQSRMALADLGVEIFDADGNFRSLVDIMRDLSVATADMNDEQKNAALGMILTEKRAREGAIVLSAASNTLATFTERLGVSGAAGEAFGTIMQATASEMQLLQNQIDITGQKLGEELAPITLKMMEIKLQLIEALGVGENQWTTYGFAVAMVAGTIVQMIAPFFLLIASMITLNTLIGIQTGKQVANTGAIVTNTLARKISRDVMFAENMMVAIHGRTLTGATSALIMNTKMVLMNTITHIKLSAAKLIDAGATSVLTAAVWSLNAAIASNPVGAILVVLSILLVVIIALTVKFGVFGKTTSALAPIIGFFAGGVRFLIDLFVLYIKVMFKVIEIFFRLNPLILVITFALDKLGIRVGTITEMFRFAGDAIGGFFNTVKEAVISAVNLAIAALNTLIEAVNKIPGVSIGKVEEFDAGGSETRPTLADTGLTTPSPPSFTTPSAPSFGGGGASPSTGPVQNITIQSISLPNVTNGAQFLRDLKFESDRAQTTQGG